MSEETKTNETDSKVKAKNPKILIAAVAVIILALAVGNYNAPAKRLARQLDLGQKYLAELDYEQAVVAFMEAIKIDPKCEQAYLSLADAYVGLGDFDSAQKILEQASGVLETTQITEKMDYVASLHEEQYKVESVEKAEEPKVKEEAKPEAEVEKPQTVESEMSVETKAEETPSAPAPTEQAKVEETTAAEVPTTPVNEEMPTTETSNTETLLPTPELETGGTWIDELYNNLIIGNYMSAGEMLKHDWEWYEHSEILKPYKDYNEADGGIDGYGNMIMYHLYYLKTSSGKDMFLSVHEVSDLQDGGLIRSYYWLWAFPQHNIHDNYAGYGDYMMYCGYDSGYNNGEYEYLVGNTAYNSNGETQILHEGEIWMTW